MKKAYNFSCAICGSSRESPDGNPEVEAAHIYPKRDNGKDHVRNGIALCRLHHWAYDTGWLAISDEYKVLVTDNPEVEGYEEFAQYEGVKLHIPENEDLQPHVRYLRAHRELHGF